MEKQIFEISQLQQNKDMTNGRQNSASACCSQPASGSQCCTPSTTADENGGACCDQPDDGTACCDK